MAVSSASWKAIHSAERWERESVGDWEKWTAAWREPRWVALKAA